MADTEPSAHPKVVGGACAWLACDQRELTDYEYWLTPSQADELVETVRRLNRAAAAPVGFAELAVDDFALQAFSDTLRSVLRDLFEGRGFALIRGVPVEELSVREAELALWGIGLNMGVPIPQNAAGDLVVHVRDQGGRFSDPTVRAYETSEALEYHTDSGDIATLLCLKPAKWGGVSTIASSSAIHDEMVRRRPDLARLLYEPWTRVAVLGGEVYSKPICERLDDRVYFGYGRMYLERASKQRAEIPPLTTEQVEALDLFDELANHPDFRLDMNFAPGDIQFLNNYTILHARTAYEDWPDAERWRDLCRLWIVRPDLRLPPSFQAHGIVSRAVAFAPTAPVEPISN